MSKHTPGPWEATGSNGYLNQCGIGRRSAHGIDPIGAAYGAGAELEANARLIAAAPEMYEALRLAQESIGRFTSDEGSTDRDFDIADTVAAALAKANGEGSR